MMRVLSFLNGIAAGGLLFQFLRTVDEQGVGKDDLVPALLILFLIGIFAFNAWILHDRS